MKFSKVSKKVSAAILSGALLSSALGMTAMAQNTPVSGSAEAVTFQKYLVMDESANVPNATFTYQIAPGTHVDGNATHAEILAGVGTPTVSDTTFAPGNTTYTTVQTGDEAVDATLDDGEKYAKQPATVDFSAVSFDKPGVYRYVITENTPTADGVTKVDGTLYLDVYVTSDSTGVLSVAGYVLHTTDAVVENSTSQRTDKVNGFVNEYATDNVTLEKLVTGNQGNRNEYFKFEVVISGAAEGTVYAVDLSDATSGSISYGSETVSNPATITIPTDDDASTTTGTTTQYFYLKHGQSIEIQGLTADTNYEISEIIDSAKGYTTKWDDVTATEYDTEEAVEETSTDTLTVSDAKYVTFENNKEVGVPTGVIMTITPYILMVGLAGVFAVLFLRKKAVES